MTNKLSKQYNYSEISVLNVKGGGGMIHFVNSRVASDTVCELDGST